jgi:hypothetical protein
MPYRPSGAAAAGPNAAVARPAAIAKSRMDVVSSRAARAGGVVRMPSARPASAETRMNTARAAATAA